MAHTSAFLVLYTNGNMALLNCIMRCICSFLLTEGLEQAGTQSSLLRVVATCVNQANDILSLPAIIILDEATANVDPENEKELMEAIQALTQEKTVIMIAHRLKTVRHADQILVVDKGQIVQRGAHDELMQQDGIYRHFISGREKAVGWKL